MIVVAVTGGIGSGKSQVTTNLGLLGATTISCDDLVQQITRKDAEVQLAIAKIMDANGVQTLTRDGVAKKMFSDPDLKRQMEELLHPLVYECIQSELIEIKSKDPDAVVVIEVPLLYEVGWKGFSAVVVVTCEEEVAVERAKRRGIIKAAGKMTDQEVEEDVRARRSQQASDDQRLSIHEKTFVIDNSSNQEQLSRLMPDLFDQISKLGPTLSLNLAG